MLVVNGSAPMLETLLPVALQRGCCLVSSSFKYFKGISRRTLSIKGFGISILPTRACRNLGLLQRLGEVGDLGTVGITI